MSSTDVFPRRWQSRPFPLPSPFRWPFRRYLSIFLPIAVSLATELTTYFCPLLQFVIKTFLYCGHQLFHSTSSSRARNKSASRLFQDTIKIH